MHLYTRHVIVTCSLTCQSALAIKPLVRVSAASLEPNQLHRALNFIILNLLLTMHCLVGFLLAAIHLVHADGSSISHAQVS